MSINSLTAIRFWRELKNSHKSQESPPWQASAASSGADSTVNPDPTRTKRGRVVGGGSVEAIYLNRLIDGVVY